MGWSDGASRTMVDGGGWGGLVGRLVVGVAVVAAAFAFAAAAATAAAAAAANG